MAHKGGGIMKKANCPNCDKELIKLNFAKHYHEFWCDECDIDIKIWENKKR